MPTGPPGTRSIVTVSSAHLVGPPITAEMIAGTAASDWLTVRSDRTAQLDVRLTLRTDDGADLFVHEHGLARTDDGTTTIRTPPRVETGDQSDARSNDTFCIGIGERTRDRVRYEPFAV